MVCCSLVVALTVNTINTSGNVGIGTTSPSYTLDVDEVGTNSTGTFLLTGGNSASNDYTQTALLKLRGTSINPNQPAHDANSSVAEIRLNHADLAGNASSGNITFYTNPSNNVNGSLAERMRIDSSGNLLVGQTSTLNNGQASIKGASGKQVLTLQTTTDANSLIQGFNSASTLAFQVTGGGNVYASGNVGIGTSSPSEKLHVAGALRIANNSADTYLGYGSNSDNYISTASGGATIFRELSTERMRIDSSGRVGIGTTNPLGNMQIVTATAGTVLNVNHNTGGTYPKASGIGLGATSTALSVSSDGSTVSFTGGAGLYAENTAASGNPTNLVFWTNATGSPAERMRLDASGNLLVGVTSNAPTTTAGINLGNNNKLHATRDGGTVLGYFNRLTSDVLEL